MVRRRELQRAIESGELDVDIAREVARECKEVSLDLSLRLLPLAAVDEPETYDDRALRWLIRWVTETPGATIDQAAEIARALVYIPSDESAMEMIRTMSERDGHDSPKASQ
jgi:hypothetical protein